MKIILASKSIRRKELLDMMNIKYEVVVSNEKEKYDNLLTPFENCINISLEKALNVKKQTSGDRIIISCDTIVEKDNKMYGKPHNEKEAYDMLKLLSGTSHNVYSCLTVIKIKGKEEEIIEKQGRGIVYVDNLSDEEIRDWIKTGNPYDKAGGYAIQMEFGKYVTKVEGDFYSIVGLPINDLYNILKEIGEDYEK